MAETPVRKVRIDDALWASFEAIAHRDGETPSGRIRRLIAQDVRQNSATQEQE